MRFLFTSGRVVCFAVAVMCFVTVPLIENTSALEGSNTRQGSRAKSGSNTKQGSDTKTGSSTKAGSSTKQGSATKQGSNTRAGSGTRGGSSSRPGNFLEGSTSRDAHQPQQRLREGTMIDDVKGFFREDGDGATFVTRDGHEFGTLPNLNLERVVRLLKNADHPTSIRWSVSGQVTEFSGKNFLLLSRAVYKSANPPPVPDQLSQVR